jgi:hypothetical protein
MQIVRNVRRNFCEHVYAVMLKNERILQLYEQYQFRRNDWKMEHPWNNNHHIYYVFVLF